MPAKHRFPAFYEKAVPVALIIIGIAVIVLLIITVIVIIRNTGI
jgi:hypothetical protein